MEDRLYWLWMALKLGHANDRFVNLMLAVESPYDLYRMDPEELAQLTDDEETIRRLSDKKLNEASNVLDDCNRKGIGILAYNDINYPKRLKNLIDPPIVLYYQGKLPAFDEHLCIAVVGTRKMSEYGQHTAYRLSYELAGCGAVVVSGMALGIDGVATCAAIEAGGTVVAVLGCGVDRVYPKAHAKLMDGVIQHGVVLSEYPPGTEPFSYNFPKRNRIISGLCQGTVVVEADSHSGALITAEHAIIQGRQLFVLPGNVNEANAEGTNRYIRDGANVALGAEDVVRFYDYPLTKPMVDYTALRYLQKQKNIREFEALTYYGVRARPYESNIKQSVGTSQMRPFSKPRVKTKILDETGKAPQVERASVASTAVPRAEKPSKQKAEPKVKEKDCKQPSKGGDGSSEILATLTETERKVFEAIPTNRSVSMDRLMSLGYKVSELIAATTCLEIKGLISSLPGSLFIRR